MMKRKLPGENIALLASIPARQSQVKRKRRERRETLASETQPFQSPRDSTGFLSFYTQKVPRPYRANALLPQLQHPSSPAREVKPCVCSQSLLAACPN